MSIIVKSEILEETAGHIDRLHTMWIRMFDPTTCDEFLLRLKNHINIFFTDLIHESTQKEDIILNEISSLRTEFDDLNRLLNQEVVIGKQPEDMPLVMWLLHLDNCIEHLKKELNERRAKIFELLVQQEHLCNELGELPLPLRPDPLPKKIELTAFCEHLDKMREQREQRLNEMSELRQLIKQDIKILDISPKNEKEMRLLNSINQTLTPETFASLRELRHVYKSQVEELQIDINEMFEKIKKLWYRLGEDVTDPTIKRRVEECKSNYNQHTFHILSQELERCQDLSNQNLQHFIEKLRLEIYKWWDLTMKSEEERKCFNNLINNCYNEDMLELYEHELNILKDFYQKNKTIFELYEQRRSLWIRMEALEAKANEPGRFNNRGGQLLKEERERNAIGTKLPKIEQQIADLVHDYQLRENALFLVFGENILDVIAEDWVTKKKNRPVYAGKMLPIPRHNATPTYTRIPISKRNISSSTFSLRKTPSQAKLVTGSTGNLNKLHHLFTRGSPTKSVKDIATPNAKRNLISCMNTLITLPVKNQLGVKGSTKSPILENTIKHSGNLGRRNLPKSQNNAKLAIKMPPPIDNMYEHIMDENCRDHDDETYQRFVSIARSSITPPNMRQPLALSGRKATPSRNQKKKILQEVNDDGNRKWRPKKL